MAAPKLAQYYSEKSGDGRSYKHPHTGQKVDSVTTILKEANKDGLIQWSADMTLNFCIQNWMLLGSRSDEDARRAGRYQWTKVRDERAEVGTGVHEAIEAEHTGSWLYPQLDEEQEEILAHWEALKSEHDIRPVLSEYTVWDAKNEYAGTADGLWWIDGRLLCVDIKTSRSHWPEHNYQLAALRRAPKVLLQNADETWREEDNPESEGRAIVHLRRDLHEIIELDNTNEGDEYEIFLHYAGVRRGKRRIKEREKAREVKF